MIDFAIYAYATTCIIVAIVLIEALVKGYTNLFWYFIFIATSPFCFIGLTTSYISGKLKDKKNDTAKVEVNK